MPIAFYYNVLQWWNFASYWNVLLCLHNAWKQAVFGWYADAGDLFDTRFELEIGKRQFVLGGYLPENNAGDLIFPGEAVPENNHLVPVLFLLKRYEVI